MTPQHVELKAERIRRRASRVEERSLLADHATSALYAIHVLSCPFPIAEPILHTKSSAAYDAAFGTQVSLFQDKVRAEWDSIFRTPF